MNQPNRQLLHQLATLNHLPRNSLLRSPPVQVKKILQHALAIRGQCVWVVPVCKVDESNKHNESTGKSDLTIPAPESNRSLRRSPCLQLHDKGHKAVGKPVCLSSYPTWNLSPGRQALVVRFLLPFCADVYLIISSLKITLYGWEGIDWCVSAVLFLLCLCFSHNQAQNRDLRSWATSGGWQWDAAWFVPSSYYLFKLAYFPTRTIAYHGTTGTRQQPYCR